MDAPIQFFRKNGSASPGILNWPFSIFVYDQELSSDSLPYFWAGDWQAPPPEICDMLTASEWRIQFRFDPSESDLDWFDSPVVSLDTTIKPGQIKRRLENGDEYIVGGDGYTSVEQIFTRDFEPSEEYDDVLGNLLFQLRYRWLIQNELTVLRVDLDIRFENPRIGKIDGEGWGWLVVPGPVFFSYDALLTDGSVDIHRVSGNLIGLMGNDYDPVPEFPIVTVDIESHFGEA